MNGSLKLANLQQSIARKYSQESTPHTFFNILTSPAIFDVVEDLLPEHRERNFPPTETLPMFLAQAMSPDSSCQNIVNEVALGRAMSGLTPFSSNTGSYCKARFRLPLQMVSELVRETGKQVSDQSPKSWNWKGRPLRLVDGTTVELTDTIENQNTFPQNKNKNGCPLARIVSIICLTSGGVMNAVTFPRKFEP